MDSAIFLFLTSPTIGTCTCTPVGAIATLHENRPVGEAVERRDYEPTRDAERVIVTAAKSMAVKVKTERGEVW